MRHRPNTEAIRKRCGEVREFGGGYIQLFADTGNSPKNWDRAIIFRGKPSLIGRCIGAGKWPGQWLFDVRVEVAEAWLAGLEARNAG